MNERMSEAQPPTSAQLLAANQEVSLEDVDRLLERSDPEFAKSLEEVRAVTPDPEVSIELSDYAKHGTMVADEKAIEAGPQNVVVEVKSRVLMAWMGLCNRIKARIAQMGRDFVVFIKTRPKEFLLFSFVMLKVLFKKLSIPVRAFIEGTWKQKLAILLLTLLTFAAGWVAMKNIKGVWLPAIQEPILANFETVADFVQEIRPDDVGESFYIAFPQQRYEFLFTKMKVNLRPTQDNPLPMGAFEFIVDLDSQNTSIEVRDREVEFRDLLQRTLEDETFKDLESDLGKIKLKSRIKRELNQKLTQGWVRDVSFKTFVLKP